MSDETRSETPAVFRDDHSKAEWRTEFVVFGPATPIGRSWVARSRSLDEACRIVPDGGIIRQRCVGYTPWQTVASA